MKSERFGNHHRIEILFLLKNFHFQVKKPINKTGLLYNFGENYTIVLPPNFRIFARFVIHLMPYP